jgi:hypothetical protein
MKAKLLKLLRKLIDKYLPPFHAANEADETSVSTVDTTIPTEEVTSPDFRAMVIEMLGLPADADDVAIQAAVDSLRAKATEMKAEDEAANERFTAGCKALGLADNSAPDAFHAAVLAVPNQIHAVMKAANEANTKLIAANEAAASARVDLAIHEGRIPVGDRAAWLAKFGSNHQVAANEISALRPMIPSQRIENPAQRTMAANDTHSRITQIQTAVNERMNAKGESYDEAFKQVQKMQPALFVKS